VEETLNVIVQGGCGQMERCRLTALSPISRFRKPEAMDVPITNVWLKIVDDQSGELTLGEKSHL